MQNKIFNIQNNTEFEKVSLEIFEYQMQNNPIYSKYASELLKGKIPNNINEIPFLPISFFKTKNICAIISLCFILSYGFLFVSFQNSYHTKSKSPKCFGLKQILCTYVVNCPVENTSLTTFCFRKPKALRSTSKPGLPT